MGSGDPGRDDLLRARPGGRDDGLAVPWLRGSIARPRLWGWGELMLGLFFAMQLMDQTVVSTPHSGDVLFYGGLAFGIAGLYLMMLARSPGTPPEVPALPYGSEVQLPPRR
ncbi:hypothetical protein [Streptomyces mirabilis]|uniref:hypothetical protein n=1 Tax=Streptomyces mirabilis TaxID=68239 RepID=UPI0036C06328